MCILGQILTSVRAFLYEFICILVTCEVHPVSLSLKLSFHSDHRFKYISPTLSFSGNEHIVQVVYLMPKTVEIMSSYGHRFFYFLVHITPRKEIYLILSSFYFLQRFLVHKAKISCFIRTRH